MLQWWPVNPLGIQQHAFVPASWCASFSSFRAMHACLEPPRPSYTLVYHNLYSTFTQPAFSHMCRVCKVVVKSARSLDGVQQGYQLTGCGQACIRQTVNTQLLEQHLRLSVPSLPFQRSRYHTAYVWSFLRTRVTSCVLRVT